MTTQNIFKTFLFLSFVIIYSFPSFAQEIDVVSKTIEIVPDFASKSIQADIEITFFVLKPTRQIIFPFKNVQAKSVTINDKAIKWRLEKEKLVLFSSNQISKGRKVVANISYNGNPGGIVFSNDSIYSNYSSCNWLLCSDESGDRFSVDLKIKADSSWTTVASDKFVKNQNDFSTWKTVRDTSGFLVGFYSGKSNIINDFFSGRKLKLVDSSLNQSERQLVLAKTKSAITFFENKSGFKLPNETYTQIVVPGNIAQEKTSHSMLGFRFLEPMFSNEKEDWLIVHELAHQWWGNSITCADWSHFWLNEGITTFMVAAYKEEKWGKEQYDSEMNLAQKRYNYAKKQNFDVPLSFSGKYPSLGVKRAITYSKGALFLDHLRKTLGDKDFWKAMKHYSVKSEGKLVNSKDFQIAFEEASGQSLKKTFDEWVYK